MQLCTATIARLMFAKILPMVWTIAKGRAATSWETEAKLTLNFPIVSSI